jgi:hypothetical protein
MRVYLGSSPALLRAAVERGELGPGPLDGHAVTPGLEAALGTGDEEELELAAMTVASLDSVRLLADSEPSARVVAVVDVPDREVRPVAADDADDVTAVVVEGPVPLRRLAAVHVDSAEASDAVAAARAVAPDDPAEEEALARCLDHDLEWYAASELTQLLERWQGPR